MRLLSLAKTANSELEYFHWLFHFQKLLAKLAKNIDPLNLFVKFCGSPTHVVTTLQSRP